MSNKLFYLGDKLWTQTAFQLIIVLIVFTFFCLPEAQSDSQPGNMISAPSATFPQTRRDALATTNSNAALKSGARSTFTSEQDISVKTQALIWGGAASILAYGATVWWKDGLSSHFRTSDEGWFGQDTYAGGADKLGHAYATYAGTRLLANAFEWAGNDRDNAVILSAATVFGTMLAVETLDGYSKRYKFSKEDVAMNAVGTGLGLLFENNKQLDDMFDFRLHYWPSGDAKRLNQVGPVGDYSGQTYLLVAMASGVPQIKHHGILRYLEMAVGYGSRGFEPNDGMPAPDRSRHVYFGISLNISEILKNTAFRGNSEKSRSQQATETLLEYIQVPGTALLFDHRL